MQKLLERFIPAADEVGYLQRQKGPECDHFRSFSEKGHYGGREKPTGTRQGTYAVAPSGEFLASINNNDPKAMAAMPRSNRSHQHLASARNIGRSGSGTVVAVCMAFTSSKRCGGDLRLPHSSNEAPPQTDEACGESGSEAEPR